MKPGRPLLIGLAILAAIVAAILLFIGLGRQTPSERYWSGSLPKVVTAESLGGKQSLGDSDWVEILRLSMESILETHTGLNSAEYYVDFSRLAFLRPGVVHAFIGSREGWHPVDGDSLLAHDSSWHHERQLEKTLIAIESVVVERHSIHVFISKLHAMEAGYGMEVILRKVDGKFTVSFGDGWVS